MPTETFFCPHCRQQLTKSAYTYVTGELMSGRSHIIALGAPVKTLTCPACGIAIDHQKVILGDYDGASARNSPPGATMGLIILVALGALIVLGLGLPWWAGLVGGVAGSFTFETIWARRARGSLR